MAQVAACPKCSCQLTVPGNLPASAQLRCPDCDEIFAPSAAPPIRLARAVVVQPPREDPPAENRVEPPASGEPQPEKSAEEEPALETPALNTPTPEAPPENPEKQTIGFEAPSTKLGSLADLLDSRSEPTPPAQQESPTPVTEPPVAADPAAAKPPAAAPQPTLSDWLQRSSQQPGQEDAESKGAAPIKADATPDEEPVAEKPITGKPVAEKPADEKPADDQPADDQPADDQPVGTKTVSGSPFATQPSLESLLSSFRGDAPPPAAPEKPASPTKRIEPQPEPEDQPQPAAELSVSPGQSSQQAAGAAAQSEPAKNPQPPTPKPAAATPPRPPASERPAASETIKPEPPKPAPTKFEDLPVESLAAEGAAIDPPPAAKREQQPAPQGRDPQPPRPTPGTGAKRSSSRLRSVSLVATSGALGLMLGYLGLLWLAGPSSDVLGVSRMLPSVMLPASFSPEVKPPLVPPPEDPPIPIATNQSRNDSQVAPAGFSAEEDEPGASVASFNEAADGPDGEPAPPGAAPTDGKVRLIGAPAPYTIAELREVLRGADDARAVMCDKSLAANPEAARELGSAYGKLCQVAQVLTFVEDDSSDREFTTLEAKELYNRLFTFGHTRVDSRAMASRWLAWSERANGGVFFAGVLTDAKPMGSVSELRVTLSDGEVVSVLTDEQMDPGRFFGVSQIGVVGCVVEDPTSRVEGYRGDATRAVWACHTFPVGKPQFE